MIRTFFANLDTTGKAVMVLVVIGLLAIAGATAFHIVDTLTETATKAGAVTERAETQGKVITNVQEGNAARAEVNDPGSCAAYRECLRSARTPANCVRYVPDDEGCPVQSGPSGGR